MNRTAEGRPFRSDLSVCIDSVHVCRCACRTYTRTRYNDIILFITLRYIYSTVFRYYIAVTSHGKYLSFELTVYYPRASHFPLLRYISIYVFLISATLLYKHEGDRVRACARARVYFYVTAQSNM